MQKVSGRDIFLITNCPEEYNNDSAIEFCRKSEDIREISVFAGGIVVIDVMLGVEHSKGTSEADAFLYKRGVKL